MASTNALTRLSILSLVACAAPIPFDAQFDPSASAALETRGGGSAHTYVRFHLDDYQDTWFMLDTGARGHHLPRPSPSAWAWSSPPRAGSAASARPSTPS